MDSFVGEIRMFAGNYAPENWQFCDGRELAISQYEMLYTLIGVTYGGNGVTTFALPDMRGRTPICQGMGTGLSNRTIGQTDGSTTVALATPNIPSHSHSFNASTVAATLNSPANALPATTAAGGLYGAASTAAPVVALADQALGVSGGNATPHKNLMPSMALSFIISLLGVFPERAT